MSTSTLGGVAIARGRVQTPAWGLWWADVDLVDEAELEGAVELVVGSVVRQGTIVSGGAYAGRSRYRVVAGAGGWGIALGAKAYRDDLGVKVASVVSDAASAVGESVGSLPSTRLDAQYARPSGLASAVLNDVAARAWYVDDEGVTQLGARAATTYSGDVVEAGRDQAAGSITLEVTDPVGLVPGVTVAGVGPAVDVDWRFEGVRLRVTCVADAGSTLPRRVAALAAIFDALDPWRRFRACYDYRIVSQAGDRLELQPTRVSSGMPDLGGVRVRPGMAGLRATFTPGAVVLVTFVGGDPSRPAVIAHEEMGGPGWMPLTLELGELATRGVARLGDTVLAGPYAGTITSASARILAGD